MAGIGIAVSGPLDTGGTRVYVSNHSSYLDALVLIATLPPEVTFVAKRELAQSRLLGPFFRRLGCLFVERHAVHEALTSAAEMHAALAARRSLLVFPEGTFQREPGLLPFHMGAFNAAAATAAAVVPVALRGTRTMLPDGALLPRPAALEVMIGTPLAPADDSWHAAVKLRQLCREYILAHVREPDLERRSGG